QLQLGFYDSALADAADAAKPPAVVSLTTADPAGDECAPSGADAAEILDLADDLEAAGEFVEAAEALRAVLQAQGPSARVMFMLAELLYRTGDLTAARERYYSVIELDPNHLQARASLGCVLAELGDHELAIAALDGVLRQEPAYADAHWHIAGVLRETGNTADAAHHLRTFLTLAPESPWADLARARLDESAAGAGQP
ncbi:MAG: tetratricopeptide repeat protein, partial [Pirellulales bacterium]